MFEATKRKFFSSPITFDQPQVTFELLSNLEEKFKAQIFYYLVNRTFGLEVQTATLNNLKVRRYIKRYDWWMEHPGLNSLYFQIIDIFNLIFVAYWGKIIKSVYSKSHRKYIWIRLKNPKWYKAHFLLVKKKITSQPLTIYSFTIDYLRCFVLPLHLFTTEID